MRFLRKNFVGGFTLIELLVVISIIAILTAVVIVSYTNIQQKGRDGKRKADITLIQQGLELYFQNVGHYPPYDAGPPVNEYVGWCTIINTSNGGWKADVYDKLVVPGYIKQIPKDPIYPGVAGDYFYKKTAKGHYQLGAVLENTNDPDISTFNFDASTAGGGGGWNGCANYLSSSYKYLVTDQ